MRGKSRQFASLVRVAPSGTFSHGLEFFQQRGHRIHRKVAGVGGGFRQASDFLDQIFSCQCADLIKTPFPEQFRQCGSARHCGYTSFREEANLRDPAVGDPDCQLENVAASWIFNLHRGIRMFDSTCIARILEVIKKLRRVHFQAL
jgi:hypothetical protein